MTLTASSARYSDVSRLVQIVFAGYEDDPARKKLYILDASIPEQVKATIETYTALLSKSSYSFVKITDSESGKIIAWALHNRSRGWETGRPFVPVEDPEYPKASLAKFNIDEIVRWECVGSTPHLHIMQVVTHPDWQRRGAATMLLKAITETADKADLPIYLEASAGLKLIYARFGFQVVKERSFDAREYGLDCAVEYNVMVRNPTGPKSGEVTERQAD